MFLYNAWYVAAWSKEVSVKPLGRTLLNEPVVLYRTADGTVMALEDRCCHRGMPLSCGEVSGGIFVANITAWFSTALARVEDSRAAAHSKKRARPQFSGRGT